MELSFGVAPPKVRVEGAVIRQDYLGFAESMIFLRSNGKSRCNWGIEQGTMVFLFSGLLKQIQVLTWIMKQTLNRFPFFCGWCLLLRYIQMVIVHCYGEQWRLTVAGPGFLVLVPLTHSMIYGGTKMAYVEISLHAKWVMTCYDYSHPQPWYWKWFGTQLHLFTAF